MGLIAWPTGERDLAQRIAGRQHQLLRTPHTPLRAVCERGLPERRFEAAEKYQGFAPTPESVIETHKDGFGFVSPSKFKAAFAHDVSDADAAFLAASQVPINMSAFETRLTAAAWRTKPSWAVIATEDKAFDQPMLVHMAKRIGAKVTKVRASHALFMTQPKVIAQISDQAAREAAPKTSKR